MSTAKLLELVAWLLSAVIAGWLVIDMIKVGRRHSEDELVNAAENPDEPPVHTPANPTEASLRGEK